MRVLATKALFLDRDGVINVDIDYLYKIDDFEFIDGILEVCKKYQDAGYKIFVVTNQSGIARGYYSEDDFKILSDWMVDEFRRNGVEISKVYHCPHHSDFGECECRKPKPGMLLKAKEEFDIDMENSIMIGDKERDIEAALNAGVMTTYLFDESLHQNSTLHVEHSKATKIIHDLKELL